MKVLNDFVSIFVIILQLFCSSSQENAKDLRKEKVVQVEKPNLVS